MYDDDFVLSLSEDFADAAKKILDEYYRFEDQRGNLTPLAGPARETRALIAELAKTRGIPDPLTSPLRALAQAADNTSALYDSLIALRKAVNTVIRKDREIADVTRFSALLGRAFHYELSDADVKRMQELINELRAMISESVYFVDGHKQRLLARLEGLQREIHKPVTNLDKFYGLVGDAGVLLGKFGRDSKPFVDRIREIAEIAWRSQASAEQLPTSARPALLRMDGKADGAES